MTNFKTVGFLGMDHISGHPAVRLMSRGGDGGDASLKLLPSANFVWGTYGHARMSATATVNGPFVKNRVLTGSTTGTKVRIVEITGDGSLIVERMFQLPPGLGTPWFNPAETITDNSTPQKSGVVGYDASSGQFAANALPVPIAYESQASHVLQSLDVNFYTPTDLSANIWWDQAAKLADKLPVQAAVVTAYSNWVAGIPANPLRPVFVDLTLANGAKALVIGVWSSTELAVVDTSGSFVTGQQVSMTGVGNNLGTTTAGLTVQSTGTWTPYCPTPNLDGIGSRWETMLAGSDTCRRNGAIGMEPYVIKRGYEKWGAEFAAIKLDVNALTKGAASGYGGPTYGCILCTGTFPSTWNAGFSAGVPRNEYIRVSAASALNTISVSASTKRFTLSSGSWTVTPTVGQKIRVSGSGQAANNGDHVVTAATSSYIECSGSNLVNESAGASMTILTFRAKLVAFDATLKHLWATEVFGELPEGVQATVLGETSASTATTDSKNIYGWMPGARHYKTWLAEVAAAKAAKGGGHTFEWPFMVCDFIEGDILLPSFSASSNGPNSTEIKLALNAFVNQLTLDLGATATTKFVIVVPPRDQHKQSRPGIADVIRLSYTEAAITNSQIRLVLPDEFTRAPDMGLGGISSVEPIWLETMAYPKLGVMLWDAYETSSLTDLSTDLTQAPVVLITGQSNAVARIHYSWWLLEDDPVLSKIEAMGPSNIDTRDPNIRIYDPFSRSWQVYSVLSTATMFGGFYGYSSFEASLLYALRQRYGEIWCIKVAVNSSSMNSSILLSLGTWDDIARPQVVSNCTVTVPSANTGRFTATSGTPFLGVAFETNYYCEISGALSGTIGGGGNNTRPSSVVGLPDPVTVKARDPAGTWVEFNGSFVVDAASKSTTFKFGPMPLKEYAGAVIRESLQKLVNDEGKIPRPIGAAVYQGENDTLNPTGYIDKVVAHCAWIRSVFGHRTGSEPECPIVWLVPSAHCSLNPAGNEPVRTALLTQLPSLVPRVAAVDMTQVTLRLESEPWPRTDEYYGVHITPSGAVKAGFLADLAFNAFTEIPPNPTQADVEIIGVGPDGESLGGAESVGDSLAGATSLIIEDGTGVAYANTFFDIAFVDDYNASHDQSAEWEALSDSDKEKTIRVATAYVMRRYANRWVGYRYSKGQGLDWPRTDVYDADGFYWEPSELHRLLLEACAEACIQVAKGVEVMPNQDAGANVIAEALQVDVISIDKTYAGTKSVTPTITAVDSILKSSGLIGRSFSLGRG